MKRTSIGLLVALAVIGGATAYLGELILQTTGGITVVPPYSIEITLVVVAIAVVAMAVPVRRRITGKRRVPLNPFYAVRVAVLSKASALTGSILLGAGVGVLAVLLGRPVLPDAGMLVPAVGLVVCSLILVVAGLIAEWMCVLPPDDPDNEAGRTTVHEPAS